MPKGLLPAPAPEAGMGLGHCHSTVTPVTGQPASHPLFLSTQANLWGPGSEQAWEAEQYSGYKLGH